jgi:hypothetical protein
LDTLIAGIATVAACAKSFTLFYLIGSTVIFRFANASASALTAIFVILLAQGISYNRLRPFAQNVGSNRQNANA